MPKNMEMVNGMRHNAIVVEDPGPNSVEHGFVHVLSLYNPSTGGMAALPIFD